MADFKKIPMTTPLVEMDGDEMTRIIWKMIKDIPDPVYRPQDRDQPPRPRAPRRDERPGHGRFRRSDEEVRRRCIVRHHYAECRACKGV